MMVVLRCEVDDDEVDDGDEYGDAMMRLMIMMSMVC